MKQFNDNKRFTNTLSKLKSDKHFQIKVINTDSKKVLFNNINGEAMIQNYGSVENFFEEIFKTGVPGIKILDRRRNGSTFISIGEPYEIEFPENANNKVAEEKTKEKIVQTLDAIPMEGLKGGLNGQMIYASLRYPEVIAENQGFKTENQKLQDRVKELEKQIMQHEFSTASADRTQQTLLGLAPVIAPILEKLFPAQAAVASVAGLTGTENLSDTKKQVINIINAVDENTAYYIGLTAKTMHNEAFQTALFELLDRFTITNKAG